MGFACVSSSSAHRMRGEIADVLGDQEIVFHEALDVAHPRMLGVAKPHRDLALDVER